MKLRPVIVGLAVLLAGCATGAPKFVPLPSHPEPASLAEALANLQGDVIIDLGAADLIAIAHNDVVAHACYPVLAKYLTPGGTGVATIDEIRGVISGFEKARVERVAIEGKLAGGIVIPPDLKLGCAALLMDERNFLIRLSVLISGGVVPGAGAIAPMLPK